MKLTPKRLLLIIAPLSLIACCLIIFGLMKSSFSPGAPQGTCSVNALLLDRSAFPPGTTMSSDENFEEFAVATAAHTFINANRGIDALQTVEYYTATFAAWQVYLEHDGIFRKTAYNDGWREPTETSFSSQKANQYRLACTNDTVVGPTCIFHARYGRYFVLLSSAVSPSFTVRDLAPLLQQIDARMSQCIQK
jgi:hypothetical protein